MAIRILPFRQYDENDVINLFAFSGTINDNPDSVTSDAGMLVSVDTANNDFSADPISLAGSDLLGKTNYPHVARNYYPEVPLKVAATAAGASDALGITLAQTLIHDENGENLLRYPQKKDELFAVASGEAVPVATKGVFTLHEDAFNVLNTAHGFVGVTSGGEDGQLDTQSSASGAIGKVLGTGTRSAQTGSDQFEGKYVVVKLDC